MSMTHGYDSVAFLLPLSRKFYMSAVGEAGRPSPFYSLSSASSEMHFPGSLLEQEGWMS